MHDGHSMALRGVLKGHSGWVTAIATTPENPDLLVSSSRDKSVLVWQITRDQENFAYPVRALRGHSHYVQDVVISSDGQFALSGSWDGTLRLWDIQSGTLTCPIFVGHKADVLSVAFSANNRQIVSASRDRTIKLWNTLGECKGTFENEGHTEWVSAVRFSPNEEVPAVVSAGWDKLVKVWEPATSKLRTNLVKHTGYVNAVAVSPDGTLSASGGKDAVVLLWDLSESKLLESLEAGSIINALAFNPHRYWLAAATDNGVRIWNIEKKEIIADITKKEIFEAPINPKLNPAAISLAWSGDSNTLFVGYTDNLIRVFSVSSGSK